MADSEVLGSIDKISLADARFLCFSAGIMVRGVRSEAAKGNFG